MSETQIALGNTPSTFNISLRGCDVARALCVDRVQFYKPVAIPIIPENPLPGVATAAHMIDGILKLDSQRSGHAPLLTKPRLMSNVKGVLPKSA